jgi:hypothetical protein
MDVADKQMVHLARLPQTSLLCVWMPCWNAGARGCRHSLVNCTLLPHRFAVQGGGWCIPVPQIRTLTYVLAHTGLSTGTSASPCTLLPLTVWHAPCWVLLALDVVAGAEGSVHCADDV